MTVTAAAAIFILAAVDLNGWGQTVFNAIFGVFVMAIAAVVSWLISQFNAMRSERDANAEKLVEEKVGAKFNALQQSIEYVGRELARINERLDTGDGKFSRLTERDGQIQVEVALQLGDVKKWMPVVAGAVAALLSPLGLVAAAGSALLGVLPELVGAMAGLSIADDIGSILSEMGKDAKAAFAWVRDTAVPALEGGLARAAKVAAPAVEGLRPVVLTVWKVMQDAFGFIGQEVVPVLIKGLGVACDVVAPIVKGLGTVLAGLAPILELAWTLTKALASTLVSSLGVAFDTLGPILQRVGGWLGWLLDLLGKIVSVVGQVGLKVANFVGLVDPVISTFAVSTRGPASGGVGTSPASPAIGGGGVTVNQSNTFAVDPNRVAQAAGAAAAAAARAAEARQRGDVAAAAQRAAVARGI